MSRTLRALASEVLLKAGLSPDYKDKARFASPPRESLDSEILAFQQLSLKRPKNLAYPINIVMYRAENYAYIVTDSVWPRDAVDLFLSHSDQFTHIDKASTLLHFAIINDLNIKPVIENLNLYIEEHVNGPAQYNSEIDPEAVLKLFQSITIFQIGRDYAGFDHNEIPYQIMSIFDPKMRGLACNPEIIKAVADLALKDIPNLPTQNLINAISAHSIRHTFLEIYKCLEFSFIVPRVKDLKLLLNNNGQQISLDHFDFARILYQRLGWKRIERDSIYQIFKYISQHRPGLFTQLSTWCPNPFPTSEEEIERTVKDISEKYYKSRNSIVHQLWPEELESYCSDDEKIMELVFFTISIIDDIYNA